LAVARRPGAATPAAPEVQAATRCELRLPPMAISSSEIRARVAAGLDIAPLVPPAVARYIEMHRLYREANRS
jgi:nicotinate-nucleotide adenylyltransferase